LILTVLLFVNYIALRFFASHHLYNCSTNRPNIRMNWKSWLLIKLRR